MTAISAPYRFVPLSKLVMLPDWADLVSHDIPFEDGLCGELTLAITAHTRLCVGGEQEPSSEHAPGRVSFYRTPTGELAIPGSSLKGMLRNVLEIASFARFRQVENQQLGVRDISDAKNFYCKTMVKRPSRSGWLTWSEGKWLIRPCDQSRLHQEDLIRHLNVNLKSWKAANTVRARYALIGPLPELTFDRQPMGGQSQQLRARPDTDGLYQGHIVVTGQPGTPFDDGKKSKKYDFVFHNPEEAQLIVPAAVMAGFNRIHEASDEWAYWRDAIQGGGLENGVPVFYHESREREIESLGLAYMYKLPYKHSLHDAIAHTHEQHLQQSRPDLPDLLFGTLGEDQSSPLRGRVNLGMAVIADPECAPRLGAAVILNSPKPTFYPTYIRQGTSGQFQTLMDDKVELAGWKRYQARPLEHGNLPPKAGNKVKVQLESVPEGTSFKARVRFHNLRRVELGALLWTLDFGGQHELRHGLGMGKPLGYGQVSIAIEDARLQPNTGDEPAGEQTPSYIEACQRCFTDLMDQVVAATGESGSWLATEPLQALLGMASPTTSTDEFNYLPEPKAFRDLKHSKNIKEVHDTFHTTMPLQPSRDFNTSIPLNYTDHFENHLANTAAEAASATQRAEFDARKKAATNEQALLMDIEQLIHRCINEPGSKTPRDHLYECLRSANNAKENLDATETQTLVYLAVKATELNNKKISKLCKKITEI